VRRLGWYVWAGLAVLGLLALGVLYVTAPFPSVTSLLRFVAEPIRRFVALVGGEVDRAQAVYPFVRAAQPEDLPDPQGHAAAFYSAAHNESTNNPEKYNYYDGEGKLHTNQTRSQREPTWRTDGKWSDPYAAGYCQIIRKNRRAWGLSDEDAFDPQANIEAWFTHASCEHWRRINRGVPDADLITKAALLYMGMGLGGVPMDASIAAIAAGGDWSDAAAAAQARYGGTGGLRLANMWSAAQAAPSWLARIQEWEGAA
jgi:hypothetical protein